MIPRDNSDLSWLVYADWLDDHDLPGAAELRAAPDLPVPPGWVYEGLGVGGGVGGGFGGVCGLGVGFGFGVGGIDDTRGVGGLGGVVGGFDGFAFGGGTEG